MIEQTNEIVRRINATVGKTILPEAQAIIPKVGRLPGIDGKAKMSKSAGNAISLSAPPEVISAAVKAMFTDPNHLRIEDSGQVEGNIVFAFLDAFDEDLSTLEELKTQYRRGGLGDGKIKRRLDELLQALIEPIRTRRSELAKDLPYVLDAIRSGTERARSRTEATKREVIEGLGLFSL